jgi:cobyrinic acid a,c-diamide synthase
VKAVVIAGVASGVGKTTIATGLMGALAARGLRVQGFKVGPDYIDPSYHTQVTGRPSRNLDSWLLPLPTLRALFARAAADADVAVVEGVMGLYDGRQQGSTAAVARLLGLPVVLVLDVSRQARSAAATALGFRLLDPAVRLVGVILNRVGSEAHRATVTEAIESAAGLPVLGALGRDAGLAVPERYLGLVPRFENPGGGEYLARGVAAVERGVDLGRLLTRCEVPPPSPPADASLFPSAPLPPRARLAVARDRAFGFYYADALDLLAAHGLELAAFSPLADPTLPDGTDGVYLGGGFPELFAADLAANRPLLRQLRRAARRGLPIYAECGGLMYLARTLTDAAGARHRLAGLVPADVSLVGARLTLGYHEATAAADSLLLQRGESVRGHEFHYSRIEPAASARPAYAIAGRVPAAEGYARDGLLASYLHLHLAGAPQLAVRFGEACAAWRAQRAAWVA